MLRPLTSQERMSQFRCIEQPDLSPLQIPQHYAHNVCGGLNVLQQLESWVHSHTCQHMSSDFPLLGYKPAWPLQHTVSIVLPCIMQMQ